MKKILILCLLCGLVFGAGYRENLIMDLNSDGIPTAIKFKSGLPGSKTIKMYNSGGQLCIGNTISPTVIDGVGDGGLLLLPESTWESSSGYELDGRYNAVNAGQLYSVIADYQDKFNKLPNNYITTDKDDGKIGNNMLTFGTDISYGFIRYKNYNYNNGSGINVLELSTKSTAEALYLNPYQQVIYIGGKHTLMAFDPTDKEYYDLQLQSGGSSSVVIGGNRTIKALSGNLNLEPQKGFGILIKNAAGENAKILGNSLTLEANKNNLHLNVPSGKLVNIGNSVKISYDGQITGVMPATLN